MIRGHDIVCFANDWDSDPLSKKHIMKRLARHNRVLWVDSVGIRNPRASARDVRRAWRKIAKWTRGLREVEPSLYVYSPVVIPFHGWRVARRVNQTLLRWMVGRACRRLGFERPIIWSFLPTTADVVGSLHEKLVVYGCVDDYAAFEGADKAAILEMESRLVRTSDVVIVSSGVLLESRKALNPDTHLVEHGVEVEHFRRACDSETPRAEQIASLPRPVIGFVGLIAEWIDAGLIHYIARHRPDCSLVLVGKEDVDTSELRRLPNVHFTGQVPYADLPSYCKCFDIAIVPFTINELTLASNPLKMREYLAAGLPVVATGLPEAARLSARTGFLRVGLGYEHFMDQVDRFLREGLAGPQMRVSRTMDRESWDAKVEQMSAIVHGAIDEMTSHRLRRRSPDRLVHTGAFR